MAKINKKKTTVKQKDKEQQYSTGIKLLVAIVWDILDFFVFRIPGLGTVTDVLGGIIALKLYGVIGAAYWWEVFDITDQLDAEVPTMTAIAIIDIIHNRG